MSCVLLIINLLLFVIALSPVFLSADLKDEMRKYLNEITNSSNVNSAEIYQGQKAGYVTGGGVTFRNRVMNLNPATVSLPRFDAGCGGIDIYTGGFSFVDDKQLVEALKSIGSASAGYAFLLALETVSPQMASTMKQLQTWSNTINTSNINSCETAAQLVGAVWPQNDMASQHICQSIGTTSGAVRDRVSQRHKCSTVESRQGAYASAGEKYADAGLDYNIAWRILQKQGAFTKDGEFAELLMTLMGTIICRDPTPTVYAPKASDEGFLRALMEGGSIGIYSCDDRKQCLSIEEKVIVIERNKTWAGRVEGLLLSIQAKVMNDEELTGEEVELLTKSRIPLYRYISILTAYKKSVCPIEIKQMAEVVALDLLSCFLRDTLESVRISCLKLRQEVPFAREIDDYVSSLEFVERSLNNYELRSARMMDQEHSIFKKMDMLEKYIASELHL